MVNHRTAWLKSLETVVLFLSDFSSPIRQLEAFISFESHGLSSRGEITPVSNKGNQYTLSLHHFTKEIKRKHNLFHIHLATLIFPFSLVLLNTFQVNVIFVERTFKIFTYTGGWYGNLGEIGLHVSCTLYSATALNTFDRKIELCT